MAPKKNDMKASKSVADAKKKNNIEVSKSYNLRSQSTQLQIPIAPRFESTSSHSSKSVIKTKSTQELYQQTTPMLQQLGLPLQFEDEDHVVFLEST